MSIVYNSNSNSTMKDTNVRHRTMQPAVFVDVMHERKPVIAQIRNSTYCLQNTVNLHMTNEFMLFMRCVCWLCVVCYVCSLTDEIGTHDPSQSRRQPAQTNTRLTKFVLDTPFTRFRNPIDTPVYTTIDTPILHTPVYQIHIRHTSLPCGLGSGVPILSAMAVDAEHLNT